MAYSAEKDVVVKNYGTISHGAQNFRVCVRRYNGGEKKLVIEGEYRGRSYRMKGIPVALLGELVEKGVISDATRESNVAA